MKELVKDRSHRGQDAIAASVRRCYESEDYGERVGTFLEKRRPRFAGR